MKRPGSGLERKKSTDDALPKKQIENLLDKQKVFFKPQLYLKLVKFTLFTQ